MLDDTFRNLHVNNFDCQKRAVCESHLHKADGSIGPIARRIVNIFRYLKKIIFKLHLMLERALKCVLLARR